MWAIQKLQQRQMRTIMHIVHNEESGTYKSSAKNSWWHVADEKANCCGLRT